MPLYVGHKNSGFKAVGNLTENNGVYSGFYAGSDLASSGYLQASQKLPEKMSNFQFFIKFTCTALGGSILSSVQDLKGLADIAIADDGTYCVWISSNGTSYDIAESFKGNYTLIAGSTYYFAFNWNGAAYQTFIKPEGAAEWTNDIYIANTKQPYTKDSVLILGIDQSDPGSPFSGSIDANQTTLYIDGKLWLANDAVKAKDLYLGGQKLAYAFLGTKNSNCITHIPQDIKLELNNGTLTLKAGSKVYVPNGKSADGSLKFDAVVIRGDTTYSSGSGWSTDPYFFVVNPNLRLSQSVNAYSGSSAPSKFGNYAFWYDTTNNLIKQTLDAGSTWTSGHSLPVGIVLNSTGSEFSSISQVFNGFGYIGNTVFALPGVKGLMADGLNADRSYKTIERTFDRFVMRTMNFNRTAFYGVVLDGEYTIQGDNYMEAAELPAAPDGYAYCYRKSDNTLWQTLNNNTWVQCHGLPIGFWTTSTVRISNFNPAKEEAETRALMCYCSYNATQTICNVNNGASWSGTLARGIYYIRGQGAGGWGNATGWGNGYGGGSGAGFEGYIHIREAKKVTVTAGKCPPDSRGNGEDTVISGVMTLGGGRIGVIGSAGDPHNGGLLSISSDIDVLSYTVKSNGNGGIIRGGGNSVLTNSGGGPSNADATAPGAGGGGSYGIYGGGKGYYGEILIKAVGAY